MPDALEAARALLRELELQLRELIGQAAADGQYEVVSQLASLTNHVGALLPAAGASPEGGARDPSVAVNGVSASDPTEKARRTAAAKKVTSRASAYPVFCRQGDALVKVGWSPSTRREYLHRVPKTGVDALVKYLVSRRSNQFPISVEAMVEALKADENAGILGYQVYVVVAWLKEERWLTANGRHGYTRLRAKGVSVERMVDELWANLPNHSEV